MNLQTTWTIFLSLSFFPFVLVLVVAPLSRSLTVLFQMLVALHPAFPGISQLLWLVSISHGQWLVTFVGFSPTALPTPCKWKQVLGQNLWGPGQSHNLTRHSMFQGQVCEKLVMLNNPLPRKKQTWFVGFANFRDGRYTHCCPIQATEVT